MVDFTSAVVWLAKPGSQTGNEHEDEPTGEGLLPAVRVTLSYNYLRETNMRRLLRNWGSDVIF